MANFRRLFIGTVLGMVVIIAGPVGEVLSKDAVEQPAQKETVAVIGTGNVGSTLGKKWAAQGHTVVYGSRTPMDGRVQSLVDATGHGATVMTPPDAVAAASVILLAVPFRAAEEVIQSIGDVSGKVLIDPINYIRVADGWPLPSDLGKSVAEVIQGWASGAHVVKAFNTMNFKVMESPESLDGPISVMLSGDEMDAKARVATLVRDVGLYPVDVGPLVTARYVEDMYRLYSGHWRNNPGQAFDYYLMPRSNPLQ